MTIFATMITTLAAYAFSRFNFRSRRPLLQAILLIQVFPNFLNMVAHLPHPAAVWHAIFRPSG